MTTPADPESQATTDLRTEFLAEFSTLHPTVPILQENDLPVAEELRQQANSEYARIEFFGGSGAQVASGGQVGGATYRNVARAVVQVFVPLGTGTKRARKLCDDAAGIFRGKKIGTALCRAPEIRKVGKDPDYPHYRMDVVVPYQHDVID